MITIYRHGMNSLSRTSNSKIGYFYDITAFQTHEFTLLRAMKKISQFSRVDKNHDFFLKNQIF